MTPNFDQHFHRKIKTFDQQTGQIIQHEIDHLSGILFYDRIDENDPWKEDPEAEVI